MYTNKPMFLAICRAAGMTEAEANDISSISGSEYADVMGIARYIERSMRAERTASAEGASHS